jgi:alkanesulfonate monooxygenase SsuD/methylene tetrahydromethanopterin reductase-like flavin-dependent oxidoreductase (luciferase family)
MSEVFGSGSVSLRLYPHGELPAEQIVATFRRQAALAAAAGFDGVMTSEHHGGFAGYLPNPIQAAGWALDEMRSGWAAPCPLLLPLRPTALVVEEVAWLAARHPGRVGAGVAAGSLQSDFDLMGVSKDGLTGRFADALQVLSRALRGEATGELAGDQAVRRCRDHPVPVLSAAMSGAAVRRAADNDVGLLFDSLTDLARCRELIDRYHEQGGTQPVVLIRRAWVGDAPTAAHRDQVDVYAGYATTSAQSHWDPAAVIAGDVAGLAERLREALEVTGADALNLRVHVPGVEPATVDAQIAALAEVLSALHK